MWNRFVELKRQLDDTRNVYGRNRTDIDEAKRECYRINDETTMLSIREKAERAKSFLKKWSEKLKPVLEKSKVGVLI